MSYNDVSDPKCSPDELVTPIGDQIQDLPRLLDVEDVTAGFDEDKVDYDDG